MAVLLPIFFLLISLICFVLLVSKPGTKLIKLPPSPPKLPIIGNLHQLGDLPHFNLTTICKKYGPLLLLQLGHTPTLLVSSIDFVKEIMNNHDIIFSNRPKSTAANIFLYGYKDTAFAPYSEYWRQTRKICVVELLSMKRVVSFEFVRKEETEELVQNIRKASSGGETSINLSQLLIATSNNIISRCIIGQKFQEKNSKRSKFGELTRRLTTQFIAFSFGDYFPYLKWIDVLTGLISRLKATFRELDPFLEKMIEERKASSSTSTSSTGTDQDEQSDKKDFMDILLQVQKDGMFDVQLTNDNLKAILLDMFVAGTDATASAMEWAMAELLKNARVMKKAQEEIRRVMGKKPWIDVNDMVQMDYLKCVLKETLRLHPPVFIPRETSESVKLGGYDIPANTRVLINAWAIHQDPSIWDRPEEFLPERFEKNPVEFKGQEFHYIPFGVGRRGCPGMAFGVFTVEYVIANLLYWFDWKLPVKATTTGENDIDMTQAFGLPVHKKFPITVLPIPYSP